MDVVEENTPAGAYLGPACVVAAQRLIHVEAELVIERDPTGTTVLRAWSGRLLAATGADRAAVAARPSTLRLPDGREGTFLPDGPVARTRTVAVTGRGLAPLDTD